MRKFSRKILLAVVCFFIVAILATPLASAVPGAEKNNDKFLSVEINKVGGPPIGPVEIIDRPEPPKEPQFRRLIMHEGMMFLEIIVDGNQYLLGEDFTYESTLIIDFHLNTNPVFCTMSIEQTYTFLPASGIDGTLEVLTVGKYWPAGQDDMGSAESYGFSTGHGTGDLEGVLLKAVGWHTAEGIHHEGYVTNWPNLN